MSAAPAPSPAEQAVIDRFGIFDEDERSPADLHTEDCTDCGCDETCTAPLPPGAES